MPCHSTAQCTKLWLCYVSIHRRTMTSLPIFHAIMWASCFPSILSCSLISLARPSFCPSLYLPISPSNFWVNLQYFYMWLCVVLTRLRNQPVCCRFPKQRLLNCCLATERWKVIRCGFRWRWLLLDWRWFYGSFYSRSAAPSVQTDQEEQTMQLFYSHPLWFVSSCWNLVRGITEHCRQTLIELKRWHY